MTAQSTLLNWLTKDELKKVLRGLDFLANKYKDEQLLNDTALQSACLKALEEQRVMNTISAEDDRIEAAKIKQALLQISEGISSKWSFEGLEIAPNRLLATLKVHWKRIAVSIVAIIGLWAGIAQISGYSIRDFLKKDEPIEKPVKTEPPAPKVSTTGNNSPAVNTREGDVNIHYGDSALKKDSTNK